MTIGPAPMMRMLLRSLRFGIAHQLREAVEEVTYVVRPGARLRMPLEAKRRPIGPRQALQGTVEEGHVRRLQIRADGRGIDGKPVVLAGDHHLAALQVLDRMVRAMVAKLHLEGPRAGGEPRSEERRVGKEVMAQ